MKEVYIINCENETQVISTRLLFKCLKKYDPSRDVVVSTPLSAEELSIPTTVHNYEITTNPTLNYFKAVVDVDCDRAIYFKPDQILTHFSTDCWETLRNLSSVVTLKTRLSFAGTDINPDNYYQDNVNLSTLKTTKNINAVYLDYSKQARQLMGFCIDFCSNYSYNDVQDFITDMVTAGNTNSLPSFPEFIWPSWLMSFASLTFEDEFIEFDFLDNIDLSCQEYNIVDHLWADTNWNKFLSYWVSEAGQLKIENFIQSGLIKYQNTAWLNDDVIDRLMSAHGQ
jgi:hypothetical protein